MSLATLPIQPGYFRPSNVSRDVRRCKDASANCQGRDSCLLTSSGCQGTLSGNPPCKETLRGLYCQHCDAEDHYYVAALNDREARCSSCDEAHGALLGTVIGVVCGALLLVIGYSRFTKRRADDKESYCEQLLHRCKKSALIRKLLLGNKLKILIGFYMIATQVGSVYEVRLPEDVSQFLHAVSVIVELGFSLAFQLAPLACVGLDGYTTKLTFWMIVPLYLVALVILKTCLEMLVEHRRRQQSSPRNADNRPRKPYSLDSSGRANLAKAVLLRAAPAVLRLLFLVYPIVTQEAFKAFSCDTFDEGMSTSSSWLRADTRIQCGSATHESAQILAGLALALYPIGLLLLFAVLLYHSREAILRRRPTPLSQALRFLYCEFRTRCFWWELVEMMRRFILVGLFVVVKQGSIEQMAYATAATVFYLAIQMKASPFQDAWDDLLGTVCSLALVLLFFLSLLYKYGSLTSLESLRAVMPPDLQNDYTVQYVCFSLALWASCLPVLLFIGALIFGRVRRKLQSQQRVRRLRRKDGDRGVPVPDPAFRMTSNTLRDFIAGRKIVPGCRKRLYQDAEAAKKLGVVPSTGPYHIFL